MDPVLTPWRLLALSAMPVPAYAQTVPEPAIAPAAAQETTGEPEQQGLGDIVVTAQRRAENLQRVPIAVTVNTAETLAAKAIAGTAELAAVTPGLTYTSGIGFALPRIRGVGSSTTLGGNENSVATYIDGVYIASATSSLLALNNIAQVAVLKGPQGTLFGRNATGGIIQITTRDPDPEFSGMASATIGNYETYGGDLYLTGGLGEGAAADLAIYYLDQRDGFGTNLFNGQDVNLTRDFAARSKIRLALGDRTNALLAFDYANSRAAQPAYRPVSGSLPVTRAPFAGGKFDSNVDRQPRFSNEQGGAALTLDHQLSSVKLVSITAVRRSKYRGSIDNDKLPVVIVETAPVQPDRQFTQELQLLSDSGGALTWVLGGYYFFGQSRFTSPVTLTTSSSGSSALQRARSFAGFGQATYALGEATKATAGLRYTREKRTFDASSFVIPASGIRRDNPDVAGSIDVGRLTWRLALDHQFDAGLLGYVSYNRGFKSGGFNPTRAVNPLLPFAPETLDAYELGLKADLFDRKVRLNGAAFYYRYQDIQLTAFNSAVATIFNAASARIYGLDLDAQVAPAAGLTVTLGVSLLHDRFGDFPGATISTPLATGGNALSFGNANGNRLPQTPDWTVNAGVDYAVGLAANTLTFSANYFHSDGWFAEADNRLRQAPYDLVNGTITLELGPARKRYLRVWGRNLLNTAYAQQINSATYVDGVNLAPGRTFGLTGGARF